jgi:Putative transposase
MVLRCDTTASGQGEAGNANGAVHSAVPYRSKRQTWCRRLLMKKAVSVAFKWKNYRLEGQERYGVMTLDTHEFIRRFLMHVLPQGFDRIRYYGLLAGPTRAQQHRAYPRAARSSLIPVDAIKAATTKPEEPKAPEHPCPCCGGRMRIIELFFVGQQPKHRPTPLPAKIRIDTS